MKQTTLRSMTARWLSRMLLMLGLFACSCLSLSAEENDTVRVHTEEHPLVYEDAWDL